VRAPEERAAAAARHGASGPRAPLPHRREAERILGVDLSGVQAVTGPAAAEATAALGATAFTAGKTAVFANPDPDLPTVVHEATHALQQGDGPIPDRLPIVARDHAKEGEASRYERLAGGGRAAARSWSAGAGIELALKPGPGQDGITNQAIPLLDKPGGNAKARLAAGTRVHVVRMVGPAYYVSTSVGGKAEDGILPSYSLNDAPAEVKKEEPKVEEPPSVDPGTDEPLADGGDAGTDELDPSLGPRMWSGPTIDEPIEDMDNVTLDGEIEEAEQWLLGQSTTDDETRRVGIQLRDLRDERRHRIFTTGTYPRPAPIGTREDRVQQAEENAATATQLAPYLENLPPNENEERYQGDAQAKLDAWNKERGIDPSTDSEWKDPEDPDAEIVTLEDMLQESYQPGAAARVKADDAPADPMYLDNWTNFHYDGYFDKNVWLTLSDGSQVPIPAGWLLNGGDPEASAEGITLSLYPRDTESGLIIPTVVNKTTMPKLFQILEENREAIETQDLLVQMVPPPPNEYDIAGMLFRGGSRFGGRYLQNRHYPRPSFNRLMVPQEQPRISRFQPRTTVPSKPFPGADPRLEAAVQDALQPQPSPYSPDLLRQGLGLPDEPAPFFTPFDAKGPYVVRFGTSGTPFELSFTGKPSRPSGWAGKWPPGPPAGPKPKVGATGALDWRYQDYLNESWKKGGSRTLPSKDEYKQKYYDVVEAGGRSGRGGGPGQDAVRKYLQEHEGFKRTENVSLGERFVKGKGDVRNDVDGVRTRPNGKDYVEVDTINKDGRPPKSFRHKIKEEMKNLQPGDEIHYVDKVNPRRRIVYKQGESPDVVDTRTATEVELKGTFTPPGEE